MSTLFSHIVSNYINAWEGHTQMEGVNFIRVQNSLSNATIDEITTEYNVLTKQHLWNTSLLDLFYDEVRERMFDETTFAISTNWLNLVDWIEQPFVSVRVGFEESYEIIDGNESFISADDPNINSFILINDSFADDVKKKIIRFFLHYDSTHLNSFLPTRNINAIVEINTPNRQLQIVGLENGADPEDRISFISAALPSISGKTIRVNAKIVKTADWNFYCRMYQALKAQNPVILDAMENRLINQVIDMDKIKDIIENKGLTFEGDKLIEINNDDSEDYEEPI